MDYFFLFFRECISKSGNRTAPNFRNDCLSIQELLRLCGGENWTHIFLFNCAVSFFTLLRTFYGLMLLKYIFFPSFAFFHFLFFSPPLLLFYCNNSGAITANFTRLSFTTKTCKSRSGSGEQLIYEPNFPTCTFSQFGKRIVSPEHKTTNICRSLYLQPEKRPSGSTSEL